MELDLDAELARYRRLPSTRHCSPLLSEAPGTGWRTAPVGFCGGAGGFWGPELAPCA